MSTQFAASLSYMCNCDEAGAQEVPDPICPQSKRLTSLSPTRIAMSLPDITISESVLVAAMPGIPSMSFIPLMSPGAGLDVDFGMFIPGMFISIFCCGDACGFGDADGMFIPGMFISIFCCGDACGFGDAAGICIPGIFISIFCCRDVYGDGLVCGMFIPGMFICWGGGLAVG